MLGEDLDTELCVTDEPLDDQSDDTEHSVRADRGCCPFDNGLNMQPQVVSARPLRSWITLLNLSPSGTAKCKQPTTDGHKRNGLFPPIERAHHCLLLPGTNWEC